MPTGTAKTKLKSRVRNSGGTTALDQRDDLKQTKGMKKRQPGGTPGNGPPTSRPRNTLESLVGLPDDFAPEEMAPAVDMESLRAYVNQSSRQSDLEREEIRGYLAHYRSWRRKLAEVLRQSIRKKRR